ncbi:alpha/beta hydrolase [Mycoplasma sp. ES3225-GEN-MYC]|uniref:alpha/beta fold hydrolase n=1 Tax=Mycoplasma miroungigenitalium TaxID=754515 RepID=UPI001C11FF00|nr:alpha/beta hydrolase [Mycoplasma miroungigenitalium]MBU4691665.1 alpha/beta hydrolase [Mycoplasma miroungigenitalium]
MLLNYIKYKNKKVPVYLEDNKKDTTILFCHGINSSSDFISKLEPFKKTYNVVAANFIGSKYTLKPNPDEINIEDWINIGKLLLNSIKTKNIIVLGHSMGGVVALNLADDKRVNKVIMMSTVNPTMTENNSYSILKSAIAPTNFVSDVIGKLIVKVSEKFKKTAKLVESFSKKGVWASLLEKVILNKEYLDSLGELYSANAEKMNFVVGSNDAIIGAKHFEKYANELGIPFTIIGKGHSPIKDDPIKANEYLNSFSLNKNRHWWNRFVTIKKHKIEFSSWKDIDDLNTEILEELGE